MILYFTGTGNSLAVARKIAAETSDTVMSLNEATKRDLSKEKVVGMVYPSYDFNAPPIVRNAIPQLTVSKDAYLFIIIACGAQAGNSIWSVRKALRDKGLRVAYSNKIRVPDNSALAFGRDPNSQKWKFERFAPRLQQIIADIKQRRQEHHFSGWSFIGWVLGRPNMERRLLGAFRPTVNANRCIGCGLCQSICPMGNIIIQERERGTTKVAVVGDNCTACIGCLHACPHQALQFGQKETLKERQYRHPDTSANDLIQKTV